MTSYPYISRQPNKIFKASILAKIIHTNPFPSQNSAKTNEPKTLSIIVLYRQIKQALSLLLAIFLYTENSFSIKTSKHITRIIQHQLVNFATLSISPPNCCTIYARNSLLTLQIFRRALMKFGKSENYEFSSEFNNPKKAIELH